MNSTPFTHAPGLKQDCTVTANDLGWHYWWIKINRDRDRETETDLNPAWSTNSKVRNDRRDSRRKGKCSDLLPNFFFFFFFFAFPVHLYSVMVTRCSPLFVNCLHVWLLVWILLGDLIWNFNVKALSIRSLTFCLTLITKRIMRGLFSGKRTVTALTEMMGNK